METKQENINQSAFDYFKKGFDLVNQYRLLWVFSLFVMFPIYIAPAVRPGKTLISLQQIAPFLGLVVLGAAFVLSIVRIITSAGLVAAVNSFKNGQKFSFGEILKNGAVHFWSMFLLHLLMDAFFVLAVIGMQIVFSLFKVMGFGGGCFNAILALILFVIFVGLLISLGVAFAFAERFLVIGDQGVLTAWKNGFALYNSHRTLAIRLGLVQASFWFITFFVTIVPRLLFGGAPMVRDLVIGILLFAVNVILGSVFHAMYTTAWIDLKDKKPSEKERNVEKTESPEENPV